MFYLADLQDEYAQSLRTNTNPQMIEEAQKNGFTADRPYDAGELRFIDDVVGATIATSPADSHAAGWKTSAGGPGSKKSTDLLRHVCGLYKIQASIPMWNQASLNGVRKAFNAGQNEARWISPDRGALLDIMDALGVSEVTPELYAQWRPAANFLLLAQMEAAFAMGYTIIHDTTLSSDKALGNLRIAREQSRHVQIRAYAAPMDQRAPAIDGRVANGFFQSWPSNIADQDDKFARNLPSFPSVADQIDFFWADGLDRSPQRIAQWDNFDGLTVSDVMGWAHFQNMYPKAAPLFEQRMSLAGPSGFEKGPK